MNQQNKKTNLRFLCSTALMTAVICIMTAVPHIPIPLGYAHLGNAFLLLTVVFLGRRSGVWAGGIGSALADLMLGFPQWMIPTWIIKAGMAWIAGLFLTDCTGNCRLTGLRSAAGCAAALVWMVAGYTLAGAVMYGGLAAGLASTPGLIVEGVLNAVVFYAVGIVLEKARVRSMIYVG